MSTIPWFPFYVDDWLGSARVRLMGAAARDLYLDCLCRQWKDGAIPADLRALAVVLGRPLPAVRRLWPAVAPHFDGLEDGRMANSKLAVLRAKAEAIAASRAEAGKAGGKAKAVARAFAIAHAQAEAEQMLWQSSKPSPSEGPPDPDPDPESDPEELPACSLRSHAPPSRGATTDGSVKTPRPARRIRARLPDRWAPSDATVAYGKSLGFSEPELERVTDEFCTYWWGEGKAKADWDQTYCNRLIQLKQVTRR